MTVVKMLGMRAQSMCYSRRPARLGEFILCLRLRRRDNESSGCLC